MKWLKRSGLAQRPNLKLCVHFLIACSVMPLNAVKMKNGRSLKESTTQKIAK
jgi:hypothetical protein